MTERRLERREVRVEIILYEVYDRLESLGPVLAPLAWFLVLAATLGVYRVVRTDLARFRRPFLVMLIVCTLAHFSDYGITLLITPDLSQEANPLWRMALALLGLKGALVYGFTGKAMLTVLEAFCLVYYLVWRDRLMPDGASTFKEFLRRFGSRTDAPLPRWRAITVYVAFLFAFFGPYFFYVATLNMVGGLLDDMALYDALPSPVAAIAVYAVTLLAAFFGVAWRRRDLNPLP